MDDMKEIIDTMRDRISAGKVAAADLMVKGVVMLNHLDPNECISMHLASIMEVINENADDRKKSLLTLSKFFLDQAKAKENG